MGWLDRVRTWGRRPSYPAAPKTTSREQWTVHGIYFDTAGWTFSGGDAHQMSWTATDAVLSVTRLTRESRGDPTRSLASAHSGESGIGQQVRTSFSSSHSRSRIGWLSWWHPRRATGSQPTIEQ